MVQAQVKSEQKIDALSRAVDSGTLAEARRMVVNLRPADVAHLLESSPPKFRQVLWQLIEVEANFFN